MPERYRGPYVILSPEEAERLLYVLPLQLEWEDLRQRIQASMTEMAKKARESSEDKE